MQELSKKEDDEEEIIRKRREKRKQMIASLQVNGENMNNPSSAPSTPTPNQVEKTSLQASPLHSIPTPPPTSIQEDKKPKEEDAFDIFADTTEPVKVESPKPPGDLPFEPKERDGNDVDIFAGDLDENNDGLVVGQVPKVTPKVSRADVGEVTDDAEGYYCYRMGEILNKKYVILGSYGKGVFSTVLRAKEQATDKDVAIKVLRNNEAMKRMGYKEIQILKDLANNDPQNKHNVVRLLDSFEDREHLCLVFEPMTGGNLREVLKKYGHHIGLSIKAVKFYAHKMIQSLKLLKKTQIIHADIKLDNILVNESKTVIKLGDFGSASPITENQITPYLVSRFYRAPEIVLGLSYGYPIDMFSVGCCIYEIATGKILFPGRSNNDMLFLFQEVAGPFPRKMTKKGLFAKNHFDERGAFRRVMQDKITGREYLKLYSFTKPTRDLKEELLKAPYDLNAEEKRMILQLHDLLSQMLTLDPAQRISVEEALKHPFFTTPSQTS